MNCPICRSVKTSKFIYRKRVPVHQNLVLFFQRDARDITRGELLLCVCETCGFVFNSRFDGAKLCYGQNYINTQTHSPYFSQYVHDIINYLVRKRQTRHKKIIEVGCGDGSFLKALCQSGDNRGIGYDPSYVESENDDTNGRVRFKKEFYGSRSLDMACDVVICRHTIEHTCDPLSLLLTIRKTMEKSLRARVFLETPCLEWILKNQVFWDFFYEHCSYFTKQSLTTAFEIAGFEIESIRNVFQGQYLWLEAKLSDKQGRGLKIFPARISVLTGKFAEKESSLIQNWKKRLGELHSAGEVAIWGAGAKGVTFVNLIDPRCRLINCVVDLNPNKQGGFVPGTGHPIVSYFDLPKRKVATAILMNPNYREENRKLLLKAGIKLNFVN